MGFNQGAFIENSLWEETAPELVPLNKLEGEYEADIAIVGAGVAGLSLALHLVQSGIRPVVIEATDPGTDATGKSGGIVASLSYRYSPQEILNQNGQETGQKLISLIGKSGEYMFSLIKEYGLDCDPQAHGFLAPARSGSELARLRLMAKEWQMQGYDIAYIEEEQIRYLTGLGMYRGALLDKSGGGVNPLGYARELARVVVEKGVPLFNNSRVQNVVHQGKGWQVKTRDGMVKANKVVLCAGGGNGYLHQSLSNTLLPLNVFEIATLPLSEESKKHILPEDHSLTDVQPDIFTIRYDKEGRLVTACPAFIYSNTRQKVIKFTENRLAKISPHLRDAKIDYVWKGTAHVGVTQLPKFYDLSEGLYAIQACNGRGLALNTMLGSIAAEFFVSSGIDDSKLWVEKPSPIPAFSIMNRLPGILMNAARYRTKLVDMVSGNQYR